MRKYSLLLAMAALSLFLFGCSQETPTGPMNDDTEITGADEDKHGGYGGGTANYEIIVENMTPATGPGASQPFSQPILATHKRNMHIFRPWRHASDELAQVAEDAVSGPLVDLLNGSSRVHAVAMGGDVILPGGDLHLEIEARSSARYLSLVFMLVNTNDAFGGLDGVRLPRHGEKIYYVKAWDAGSERNTELATDIPGPCCGSPGMGTDEHKVVRRHRGIMGVGDLDPETYGWEGRVAKVTVRRLD